MNCKKACLTFFFSAEKNPNKLKSYFNGSEILFRLPLVICVRISTAPVK